MNLPTSHSWTSLQQYEKCPALYRAMYVDKTVVLPPTPAMARGRKVHQMIENGAKGVTYWDTKGQRWTRQFMQSATQLQRINEKDLAAVQYAAEALATLWSQYSLTPHRALWEQKFGLSRTFSVVGWNEAFVRGVIDGLLPFDLIDWKTGQSTADERQFHLYAIRHTTAVRGIFVYLDQRRYEVFEITDADRELAKLRVTGLVDQIEQRMFEPIRNQDCHRCPLLRNCKAWKEVPRACDPGRATDRLSGVDISEF